MWRERRRVGYHGVSADNPILVTMINIYYSSVVILLGSSNCYV